jgi:hypothetical protein
VRRIVFPAIALVVAGLIWWLERAEERRPVRRSEPASAPSDGPRDPDGMKIGPVPPKPPPATDPAPR